MPRLRAALVREVFHPVHKAPVPAAIKHVLCIVRRISTGTVCGLSPPGSVEGHLFLGQRAQTRLGPETEKRKRTK